MENTAISVTIKTRILNEIDNSRGDVPRSKYISRLLEHLIEESKLEVANNKVIVDRNSLTATDQQRIIVRGD